MRRVAWCVSVAAIVMWLAIRPSATVTGTVVTSGPASCHAMALTFDLCPVQEGSGFDVPLVKFLEEHHVHATFFASGRWIATHDAELRELLAQPFFEVGTHGQVHAHLPKLTPQAQAAEIQGPIRTLADRYGVHAVLFRPPYGEYNDETVHEAEAAGQSVVMWSVVSGDPDPKLTAAGIIDDVARRVKNGSIIIFHANGRGWHTRDVVPALYQRLVVTKGFATDTVTELGAGCKAHD